MQNGMWNKQFIDTKMSISLQALFITVHNNNLFSVLIIYLMKFKEKVLTMEFYCN